MKVLLKEGADRPTPATILVLLVQSLREEVAFETLIGETIPRTRKGVVAESPEGPVVDAVNVAAKERDNPNVTPRDLIGSLRHLNKRLHDYEVSSKIGLKEAKGRVVFDDSDAKRVDRAGGLARGDQIAIGPSIRPKAYMNARGTVVSVGDGKVEVDLDPGDHDRVERERGRPIAKRQIVPVSCVEKIN
jgi:hypothetical protein